MSKVTVVDKGDQILGYQERETCHQTQGILHRALCVFILNKKGELLLQQRSKYKKLWPMFWSNSCCSHPISQENILAESQKRLEEELGFSAKLNFIDKFIYFFPYKDIGSEHELAYVYLGEYSGVVSPNDQEVASYKWVTADWLKKAIKQNPNDYTPWFKLEFKELIKRKLLR